MSNLNLKGIWIPIEILTDEKLSDIEGEDGGTTIIIDGEYIYDIIEKEGDVDFEPQGTVDKLLPRIDILETSMEGSTIKVKVATKRNEEGTLEFYIKEENETDYTKKETVEQAPEEYEYLFEEIDVTKVYQIKVVAIAKNGERKEKEVTVVGIPTLNSSNTIFSYTPTNDTPGNVTVTITTKNINMAGYTLQYAIDDPKIESNWKNYTTSIPMQQNGDVYVRLKDKQKGQVGRYTKIGTIHNIDKTPPSTPTLEVTKVMTNRIELVGSATDEGTGVAKYYFGISKDDGTTWETKEVLPIEGQETVNCIFEELTQDKDYKLQLIAEDKVGNKSEAKSVTQKTTEMPVLQEADITFTYNPKLNANGWTNQTVTVTASIASEELREKGYRLYTSKTGEKESFTEQANQIFEENGILYIKLYDGTNYGGAATFNMDKIDRLPPDEFTIQKIETTNENAVVELKDVADDIKQIYQFVCSVDASLSGGGDYCYHHDCKVGDVIYCTGEKLDQYAKDIPVGYYKAIKNTQNHYDSAPLTNTEYFRYLGPNYKVSSAIRVELKDAADDIKHTYQFVRSVDASLSGGGEYCYNYDCKVGDVIYCTGEKPDQYAKDIPVGYYKAIKNTQNHYASAPLTNTEYFEYLGVTYTIPYVYDITIAPTNEVTDPLDSTEKCSGINQYYFSKDGGKNWLINEETGSQIKTSYTFKELTYGEECTFIMKVVDNAGNERLSDEKKVTIR